MKGGKGKGKEGNPTFLSHPFPALLLAPFFARSLTPVPRSLLQNRTETLATQAKIKCKTFVVKMRFICVRITKNHLQINGFSLSLGLKQRLKTAWKWPIVHL